MSRPGIEALRRRGGERLAPLVSRRAAAPLTRRVLASMLPRSFRPEAARGLTATFELRVDDMVFGLRVTDGELSLADGPVANAAAGVEVTATDLVRLRAGAVGWPELLATGQLTLRGDPFLALRFPALFGLPVE